MFGIVRSGKTMTLYKSYLLAFMLLGAVYFSHLAILSFSLAVLAHSVVAIALWKFCAKSSTITVRGIQQLNLIRSGDPKVANLIWKLKIFGWAVCLAAYFGSLIESGFLVSVLLASMSVYSFGEILLQRWAKSLGVEIELNN